MLSRFAFGHAGSIDESDLVKDFGRLLTEKESFMAGFQVMWDTFIFTDKRMITVEVQDVLGKKKDYLTIPYHNITKYSIESSGNFDRDAELKIWVGSDPAPIEKTFNETSDIYELQRILSAYVLQ